MTQATQLRMCFSCCIEKPAEVFSKAKPNSCKECITAKAKQRYHDSPAERERMRVYAKARYQEHREEMREYGRAYYAKNLAAAVAVYGGCCARCGSTDRLEFDHVNGDGAEHRKREHNQLMLRRIARTSARLPDVELQLLCHAHHWEKTLAERRAKRSR